MPNDRGVINRGSRDFRLIVDLDEVQAALTAALDTVRAEHGRWLSFTEDFYWRVLGSRLTEDAINPDTGLASLVDDYSEGVEFLQEDEQARREVWRHALEHLGGLLRHMGEFGVATATSAEVDAANL
ncbi:MAG TPA: hypothetical protein VHC43_03815 [Mycobacteriales bacterium]|nr:hypothetical protein [Mycobacteriales bacterium]